jgi:hypothetical protein
MPAMSCEPSAVSYSSSRLLPVAILALAMFAAVPASAQTVGMAVETPLGGYFRAGRWIPLNCALTNQGPPTDVRVKAQMRDYGPNSVQRTYELNVSLPAPANRRYSLYVLPPGAFASRPLEVELLQDRRVVGKQEQSLRPLSETDRLVAVIASEEGGFGGLSGSKIPVRTNQSVPPGYGPGGYPGGNPGQVQVAYVKPELAPDRAIGYQIADLVVVGGISSGSLTPAQETALARWVQAGGTLIVTGGADTAALRTPTLRALLPVEITGTATLSSRELSGLRGELDRMRSRTAAPAASSDASRLPPGGVFVVSASRPQPGVDTVWARPGLPMLAAWPVGAGQVVFLAADPARPPLRGWDGLTDLWRYFLFQRSPATHYLSTVDESEQFGGGAPYYYGQSGRQPALANACLQVSQMDVPGFAFIGLFLLAYIVVLVPLNYQFLKRRDRRELAWVTTPGIVFLFSGLAYLIGYGTKGGQIVVAQAGIVEAWAGRNSAPALTYLGLFSPRKTRYDFGTEEGAVPLQPVDSDDSHRALRVVQGDGFWLKDVPIDMWDMGLFRGDSVVELGEGFRSELKLVDGKLVGRVTNRSPFDLEDAVLLTGGSGGVYWGTLKHGQSHTVAAAWNPGVSGGLLPPAALQTVHGGGAPARMRRALVEPLTTWSPAGGGRGGASPGHPVLIGWVSQPLVPARVDGRQVREQAAHLFLVHLPLK